MLCHGKVRGGPVSHCSQRKGEEGLGLQERKRPCSSREPREERLCLPLDNKDVMSGKAAAIFKKT